MRLPPSCARMRRASPAAGTGGYCFLPALCCLGQPRQRTPTAPDLLDGWKEVTDALDSAIKPPAVATGGSDPVVSVCRRSAIPSVANVTAILSVPSHRAGGDSATVRRGTTLRTRPGDRRRSAGLAGRRDPEHQRAARVAAPRRLPLRGESRGARGTATAGAVRTTPSRPMSPRPWCAWPPPATRERTTPTSPSCCGSTRAWT